MPALSIKPEFNEKIHSGSKLFTLRHPRKDGRDTRVGQTLYFYNGLRTKKPTKVAERPCRFAANVRMLYGWIAVGDWSAAIFPEQLDRFAVADGFVNYAAFCKFHAVVDGMEMRQMKMMAWEDEQKLKTLILGARFALPEFSNR